jgi:hypothetical protein
MRGFWIVGICAVAMCGPGARNLRAQAAAGAAACEVPIAVEPVDEGVMKLLSTPAVPIFQTTFTAASARPIKQWDLPGKVTAWQERPSAAEMSRRWDELGKSWYKTGVPAGAYRPYAALRVAPKEWEELRQWIAKNGPKQLAGTCVAEAEKNARYILVGGEIRDRSAGGGGNATRDTQYSEYSGAPRQDNIGANAGTVSPTAHQSTYDEMSGHGGAGDAAVYACVFLYRMERQAGREEGVRSATPAYYYCRAESSLKFSAGTMLKFLAKNGLP